MKSSPTPKGVGYNRQKAIKDVDLPVKSSPWAWNLKSWYGQLMPDGRRGREVMMMEFRRFLHLVIRIPCQIVRTGRKIVYRILGYNDHLPDFIATWRRLRRLRWA